jgi:hypothetical protein
MLQPFPRNSASANRPAVDVELAQPLDPAATSKSGNVDRLYAQLAEHDPGLFAQVAELPIHKQAVIHRLIHHWADGQH